MENEGISEASIFVTVDICVNAKANGVFMKLNLYSKYRHRRRLRHHCRIIRIV